MATPPSALSQRPTRPLLSSTDESVASWHWLHVRTYAVCRRRARRTGARSIHTRRVRRLDVGGDGRVAGLPRDQEAPRESRRVPGRRRRLWAGPVQRRERGVHEVADVVGRRRRSRAVGTSPLLNAPSWLELPDAEQLQRSGNVHVEVVVERRLDADPRPHQVGRGQARACDLSSAACTERRSALSSRRW